MATLAQLRSRIANRLGEGQVVEMDKVANATSPNDPTIVVTYGRAGLDPGAIVEFPSGEQAMIWDYNRNTKALTVERGWNGTVSQNIEAGSIVRINPRFSLQDLLQYMEEEILSWPPVFGRVVETELVAGSGTTSVDSGLVAGDEVRAIVSAARKTDESSTWGRWHSIDVRLIRDPLRNDFPSGLGIQLPISGLLPRDRLQIVYLVGFDLSVLTVTTDLQALGVPKSMEDILVYGVQARALSTKEIPRTDPTARQTSGHREQAPPTHVLQTSAALWALRKERLGEEEARVHAQWPILRSAV